MTGIRPLIDPSAVLATGAIVLGRVTLGRIARVWYNAVIRADTDAITIDDESDIQELAMLHADPG